MKKENVQYFESLSDSSLGEIFGNISGKSGAGIIVLVAEQNVDDVPKLQKMANDAGVKIAGGVFPGLIVNGRVPMKGFTVFTYEKFPDYILLSDIDRKLDESTGKIADFIEEHEKISEAGTLYMFLDGYLAHASMLLDSIFREVGDQVHYFGSACGAAARDDMACVFDNNQFVIRGFIGFFLDYESDPVLEHGYKIRDVNANIGMVEDNRITEINWKPAIEAYREILKDDFPFSTDISPEDFLLVGARFPFGISRLDGENVVRVPVGISGEGALLCAGEFPQNSAIVMMTPVKPGNEDAVNAIARRIDGAATEIILIYYCIGRRLNLGDEASDRELSLLSERFPDSDIYGALSMGEIGNSLKGGYPLLQNATILCSGLK